MAPTTISSNEIVELFGVPPQQTSLDVDDDPSECSEKITEIINLGMELFIPHSIKNTT
ncbi:hypothetical protein HHI36_005308, partial [Cryptolaemus montrouzieri]